MIYWGIFLRTFVLGSKKNRPSSLRRFFMVYEKIDNYLTDAKLAQTDPHIGCGGFKKIKESLM